MPLHRRSECIRLVSETCLRLTAVAVGQSGRCGDGDGQRGGNSAVPDFCGGAAEQKSGHSERMCADSPVFGFNGGLGLLSQRAHMSTH